MSTSELTSAIKALPNQEKIELLEFIAADIVRTAPPAVKAAQITEVQRRRQEWLDGKAQLIPGDKVMREMGDFLDK